MRRKGSSTQAEPEAAAGAAGLEMSAGMARSGVGVTTLWFLLNYTVMRRCSSETKQNKKKSRTKKSHKI